MGTHYFKYNNVPLFAQKPGNINTSMFAAPKLALVPASRYNCYVKYNNVPLFLLENQGISIPRCLLSRN